MTFFNRHILNLWSILLLFVFDSCSVLKVTSKHELVNDNYIQITRELKQKVYINIDADDIVVYSLKNKQIKSADQYKVYPLLATAESIKTVFRRNSLDFDFLTMPLKFRPKMSNVPAQLNASINGAVYLGYRTDNYRLKYVTNPLGSMNREIIHTGFSFGFFSGIGNTFMSPTNTNNILQQEYDGIVWNKGISGIIALNTLSIGVAVGFDNLLDNNRKIWIYESKPWVGLTFGLNLN